MRTIGMFKKSTSIALIVTLVKSANPTF